jgi:proteasome lid subunit RPN8/RPN11
MESPGGLRALHLRAMASIPPVHSSDRLDPHLDVARALLERYSLLSRTTASASDRYLAGATFIAMSLSVQRHSGAASPSVRPLVAFLAAKSSALAKELDADLGPRVLAELALSRPVAEVLPAPLPPPPHPSAPAWDDAPSIQPTTAGSLLSYPSFAGAPHIASSSSSSSSSMARALPASAGPVRYPSLLASSSFSTASGPAPAPSFTPSYAPYAAMAPAAAAALTTTTSYPRFGTGSTHAYPTGAGPSSSPAAASSSLPSSAPAHSHATLRRMLRGLEPVVDTPASRQSPPSSMPHLRRLRIPDSLIPTFLQLADTNTNAPPRGVETCGILCGTMADAALTVTHLVLPKQRGEADSCEMESEEEVLEATVSAGVLTLGWVHTHPSQGCFLSSLDLHTHLSYQILLPEAVAIVLSPRVAQGPSMAVFRLTDGEDGGGGGAWGGAWGGASGLELIQACDLRGFHPHNEPPEALYEQSGHAEFLRTGGGGGGLTVIDLRRR